MSRPTPAVRDLAADELDELRAVYATLDALHHIPFEQALHDTTFRICLWNVAQARRKTRARLAADAEYFQLTP